MLFPTYHWKELRASLTRKESCLKKEGLNDLNCPQEVVGL